MTLHLTQEQARALGIDEAGKRHKFGASTDKNLLTLDNYKFDSKLELSRYCQLKQLERANLIAQLRVHPTWEIVINSVPVCKVELDFSYWDRNQNKWVYEDTKGMETPYSRLKRKMLLAAHGIVVTLVRAQRKGWAR